MKKIFFKTFGCRTNIYDTNIMMSNIKDFNIVADENSADFIIINSCTVTNKADSSTRNYINKMNKLGKKTFLAGCGAISKGSQLFNDKKIFGVLGHSEKQNINQLLHSTDGFFEIGDLHSIDQTIVTDFQNKTKAYIKIQEGCNFKCSYCIIPSVRGGARSQAEHKILTQIKTLAQNGYGEFVLTGTNIGSYGKDTGSNIAKLIKKISLINGVKRVRVGSLEPSQIDDEFIELLNENFLEQHLHIALQHTSEKMLRIMRRKNSFANDIKLFQKIAQKNITLGTDFIVGHPFESSDIWQEALVKFREFPITHLHGFTFSPRADTHSATLKSDVKGDVAKKRLKQLEEITKEKNFEFRKNLTTPLSILVEEKNGEYFRGYDQYFNKILIASDEDILKNWIEIKNFEVTDETNFAKF